jgi:hypothetical protein
MSLSAITGATTRRLETIAHWLRAQAIGVFFDRWYLAPGKPWRQELEEVLRKCQTVAVCVGPGEMGPWQQREVSFALDRQAQDASVRVIPVLLPGSESVLGFLGQNTWIDLRAHLDDPIHLYALERAIRGEPAGADIAEQVRATLAAVYPYRGLLYFREEDAPFFFGRDAAIHDIVTAVTRANFVAVVGASGSGKSSVVRAGLLPVLRRARDRTWDITTLVPGDRPLRALAATFIPLLEPNMTETDRLIEVKKQVQALQSGDLRLRDIVDRVLTKQEGTDRLLLFVDQWEELYTLTQDDTVRKRFIDELLDATEKSQALCTVLTIRGDFVGHAFGHRPLVDRWKDAQVSLGPMQRAELDQIIQEPATKVGLRFAPGLVDRMLNDVGEQPGNLPLLEFVLKELWKTRRGGEMLHEAYDAMGQLQGAIARKAEDVFGSFSREEQHAVQRVFLQLVHPSESAEDTRRRASFTEISPSFLPLVWKLADQEHRLLVTSKNTITSEDTVEVSHEALIRSWARLQGWLKADREFLLWRERFRAVKADWQGKSKDDRLLLRDPLLTEAEGWLAKRGDQLIEDDHLYIQVSAALRAREEQVENERRERELAQAQAPAEEQAKRVQEQAKRIEQQVKTSKQMKVFLTLLGTAMIGLIILSTIFIRQRNTAVAEKDRADRISKIALSRQLDVQSSSNLSRKFDRALLLGIASHRVAETSQTPGALLRALVSAPRRFSFGWGHHDGVMSVAFSPDGKTLASASGDQRIILWDVTTRQPLGAPLTDHHDVVWSVAFSPDGKTLASASVDPRVILWDVDVNSWEKLACAIANRNLTYAEWTQYIGDAMPYQAVCPDLSMPKE